MSVIVWLTEIEVEMEAEKSRLEIAPAVAVEHIERGIGLNDTELATALGSSPKTVERWRSGQTYPQHEARERLARLLALVDRLRETFDDADAARTWLRTESFYLGGLTPAEVLYAGRPDRVEAALEALDSGVFI
jgi:putative toxin-antitoxin system antitoxin component (TIGR02293 family)